MGGAVTIEDSWYLNNQIKCDCDYNVEDCFGVCGGDAVVDCAGECNGSGVVDECGVCNGEGPQFECDDGTFSCNENDCYYSR